MQNESNKKKTVCSKIKKYEIIKSRGRGKESSIFEVGKQ